MENTKKLTKLVNEFRIEELQERLEFTTLTSATAEPTTINNYAAGDVIYGVNEAQIEQAKASAGDKDIRIVPGPDGDGIGIEIVVWRF